MKKIVFAAIAATAILASCSKATENAAIVTDPADGPQVQIVLKAEESGTRAFFDDTGAAESWESEIKTLTVYVCNSAGNIILKRAMTQSEIDAKSARFSLPNSTRGTNCTFFVAANNDYGNPLDITALNNQIESFTPDQYNGTFDQITTGSKRSAGFVMTGKTVSLIGGAGETTSINVTLKRVVAKIAVRAQLSADFSSVYYGGKVVITSVTMSQSAEGSYSFLNSSPYSQGMRDYSYTQPTDVSGTTFRNFFYAYECSPPAQESDRIKFVLSGYFDADGNTATTTDRTDVSYVFYMFGSGGGEINRNNYYRLDAYILGISGDSLVVNFDVADWELPITQLIHLGV